MRFRAIIGILAALTVVLWALGQKRKSPDALQAADLEDARAAFLGNISAIQQRDKTAYLSYYLQSPTLTILSDSLQQGYEPFATARLASNDWPDTLIAEQPSLVWLSPGVVWGAYRYTRVQRGETTRGWSERVLIKTRDGWKVSVTTAFKN